MEQQHITITDLGNGILRISAPSGWQLYYIKTEQVYANGSTIKEKDLRYWTLVPA